MSTPPTLDKLVYKHPGHTITYAQRLRKQYSLIDIHIHKMDCRVPSKNYAVLKRNYCTLGIVTKYTQTQLLVYKIM